MYKAALDDNYFDPRFRTEYVVTEDMKCVETEVYCDFHGLNMVLQPSDTVLTNAGTDYYPYYTCQQICDATYQVLANGTCAKDAYCGAGALTSTYVATKVDAGYT